MKKTFTTILLTALCCSVSFANPIQRQLQEPVPGTFKSIRLENIQKVNKAQLLAESEQLSIDYSPADEPYSAFCLQGTKGNETYAQAFELTPEVATKFANNVITSFNFYTGINASSRKNQIKDYTVFLTYDLEEEPFYTQDYTTTSTTAYTYCNVVLDTPYVIEAGKSVYIGMRYKLTSATDYTLVADGIDHGDDYSGGWLGIYSSDGKVSWNNFADQIGFFTLGVTISGTSMPNNLVSVPIVSTQPVVVAGTPFTFEVYIFNNGASNVTSMDLEYTIGKNEPVRESFTFNGSGLPFNNYTKLTAPDNVYDEASAEDVEISFTVTKVNGVENNDPDKTGTTTFICVPPGEGYQKQVVVEELTGTWCSYCPAGIVAMEKIRAEFPDGGLIPVCVHVNDEMYATSWANVAAMSSTVPSAFLNRQIQVYPQYEYLIDSYETLKAIPALGKVELTAEPVEGSSNKIHVKATTEFLYDMSDASDRYRLCFAITRDNDGPYNQTNYYAGENVDCGGWENLAGSVPTMYNDVAFTLTTYEGIQGSIPDNVTAKTQYTYERDLQISSKVPMEDVHAIVYLLDIKRGTIENAATVKHIAGIDSVIADSHDNAPVEYFNIQGVRVENPGKGLYIRRQGNEVSKIHIR